LSPGATHNARWTLGEGCAATVKLVDMSTDGWAAKAITDVPTDELHFAPIAAGACSLSVDYLGVRGEAKLVVK
jgi:hypothetical protein